MKTTPQDVRAIIRQRMHERDMSINELHPMVPETSRASLYRFLNGKTNAIDIKALERVLAVLGLHIG